MSEVSSVEQAYKVLSDWFAEVEKEIGRPMTKDEKKYLIKKTCETHDIEFNW